MRENIHQMRAGKSHRKARGGPLEAGLSNVQVREREELSPAELMERLVAVAPVTVRKRSKMPSLMRKMKMKIDGPVFEKWALGYLIDTIYLRDLWMHRVDAAHVTGRDLVLTQDHDGRIVADVVAEWARRHGQPFTLTLTAEPEDPLPPQMAGGRASPSNSTRWSSAACLQAVPRPPAC